MDEPQIAVELDRLLAKAREYHPGHTDAWYEIYVQRVAHYLEHKGDMTEAPELPEN